MLSFTVKPRGLRGPNLTRVKVPSERVYGSNEQAQVTDRYPKQTDNLWPLQRWRAKSWNSIQRWGPPSFREDCQDLQSTVTKQRIRRCCKDWHLQSCWWSVWVWASEIKLNQIVGIHFGCSLLFQQPVSNRQAAVLKSTHKTPSGSWRNQKNFSFFQQTVSQMWSVVF